MNIKLIESLKKFHQKLFPDYYYVISELMAKELSNKNLVVADVGAAYGTDSRWHPVKNLTQFVTFEPDTRSQDYTTTNKTVNFATGLSNIKGQQCLYLTKLPAASSLYPINSEQIQNFANKDWHEVVGSTLIELDTLDNCLATRQELKPDFLKVDVEGADLDVIKGGVNALENSILGLQIEVSFIERHKGAPCFSETDTFLKSQGFDLFILAREHWLRKNLVHGINCHPQLIWGDAVYFLNKDKLFARIESVESQEKPVLLIKYLVILLAYGAYDYAIEIIDDALSQNIISEENAQGFKRTIMSSIISPFSYLIRHVLALLLGAAVYLVFLPLGFIRKRLAVYLNKHIRKLAYFVLTNTSKGGIYNSCISDFL
ncbi:MAG: FkbM family methyltransferase [Sphaerospermopsis sp. SIO1G1]|nr:FkbM family methyltransferase [Sphaerospermopsis sp. SIO1G1]